MADGELTPKSSGGPTNAEMDVAAKDEAMSQLFQYEPTEEAWERGSAGPEMVGELITWFASRTPEVRANVYVAIALMATTDPSALNDAEIVIYSFAHNDHAAVKAAEAGRVQALEVGDVDADNVLVDEDWFEDHVHHNGKREEAREYMIGLFDATPAEEPSGITGWAFGAKPDSLAPADDLMLAIESGLNLDDRDWGAVFEEKSLRETGADTFFGTLDAISYAARAIAPVVSLGTMATGASYGMSGRTAGIRTGGWWSNQSKTGLGDWLRKPTADVPARVNIGTGPQRFASEPKIPGGGATEPMPLPRTDSIFPGRTVSLSNESVFRNGEALAAVWKHPAAMAGATQARVQQLPNWMRPFSYASTRVGQPLREVIVNAATSDKAYKRMPGVVASQMTRNRFTRRLSFAAPLIVGSLAAGPAVSEIWQEEYAEGRDQMDAEQLARDEALDKKRAMDAQWKADTLNRETERRERARAMYPSTEQPGGTS